MYQVTDLVFDCAVLFTGRCVRALGQHVMAVGQVKLRDRLFSKLSELGNR